MIKKSKVTHRDITSLHVTYLFLRSELGLLFQRVPLAGVDESLDVQQFVRIADVVDGSVDVDAQPFDARSELVEIVDERVHEIFGVLETARGAVAHDLDQLDLVGCFDTVGTGGIPQSNAIHIGCDDGENVHVCSFLVSADNEIADQSSDGKHHTESNDKTSDIMHGYLLLMFFCT